MRKNKRGEEPHRLKGIASGGWVSNHRAYFFGGLFTLPRLISVPERTPYDSGEIPG